MAIGVLSLVRAPTFCARLKKQFLLGERNQAFTTEYAAGIETIKSLQMEPQLKASCNGHLADCLLSGFRMKQFANGLEQLMTMLILVIGAYPLPPIKLNTCHDRDAPPRNR